MNTQTNPLIAITFDDGPNPIYTPKILDLVSHYNIHVSFSVLGDLAARHPGIVRCAVELGCEIINHSWNHENFLKLTEPEISDNLIRTENAIYDSCHVHTAFVRPPYGNSDDRVEQITKAMGKSLIFWDVDSLDWKDKDAAVTVPKVISETGEGNIILLHDIYKTTYEAAIKIIPALLDKGYTPVTVSELTSHCSCSLTSS